MNSSPAQDLRHALRIASAWAALAFVCWRGALGLLDGGVEMRSWRLSERRFDWNASLEQRMERALGDDFELWRAIEAHVPPLESVVVVYPREHGASSEALREPGGSESWLRRLQRLRAVACPRFLDGFPYDPRHPAQLDPAQAGPLYVLDLDSGCDLSVLPRVETLARGKNFTLLHAGGAAR